MTVIVYVITCGEGTSRPHGFWAEERMLQRHLWSKIYSSPCFRTQKPKLVEEWDDLD